MSFYQQEIFDEDLKCPFCSKKFDVPKLLPCGYSICSKCEAERYHTPFKCALCEETHNLQNPLTVNAQLNRVLHRHPSQIHRGNIHSETLKSIESVETHCKDFIHAIQNGEQRIRMHCDFLRDEVDLSAESLIEEIKRHREKYIAEISTYEKKCIETLKRDEKELVIDVKDFIDYIESKCSKWRHTANDIEFDENNLREVSRDASKYKILLKYYNKRFENLIFNGTKMAFREAKEKFSESVFGSLDINEVVVSELKNCDKITPMKTNIFDSSFYSIGAIGCKNGVIVLYVSYDKIDDYNLDQGVSYRYNVNIQCYSKELERLKNIEIANFNCYEVALLEKEVALILSGDGGNRLMVYDERLLEKRSLMLKYSWLSISAFDNELYVAAEKNPVVHVYDFELNEIKQFGQNVSPTDEFYYKPKAEIFFSDYTIFQVNEDSVDVLDKTTLRLLRSFEFDNARYLLKINADSTYYLLKLADKVIDLCDFEGNVIETTKLPHVNEITSFFVNEYGDVVLIADKRLVFFSK